MKFCKFSSTVFRPEKTYRLHVKRSLQLVYFSKNNAAIFCCICKTFKLVSKQWLKIICFVSIASGSPQGVQTKEDQRRLSGEAKCGELIQSFYIILLTNKLFAWRKNYKVFTVQRVFEDVSRAEEMWKVGLMSSFSSSPGFPIWFF